MITRGSGTPTELGAKEQELTYEPYGKTRSSTGSTDVHHKFTGQELDDSTGLYNYGARYYDPILARFISANTVEPDYRDPQSLNRYSYTRNNPLKYIDPSGNEYESFDSSFYYDYWWLPSTDYYQPAWGSLGSYQPFLLQMPFATFNFNLNTGSGSLFGGSPQFVGFNPTSDSYIGGRPENEWFVHAFTFIRSSDWGQTNTGFVDQAWGLYQTPGKFIVGPTSPRDGGANFDPLTRVSTFDFKRIDAMPGGLTFNLPGIIVHEACHALCLGQQPWSGSDAIAHNEFEANNLQVDFNKSRFPDTKFYGPNGSGPYPAQEYFNETEIRVRYGLPPARSGY